MVQPAGRTPPLQTEGGLLTRLGEGIDEHVRHRCAPVCAGVRIRGETALPAARASRQRHWCQLRIRRAVVRGSALLLCATLTVASRVDCGTNKRPPVGVVAGPLWDPQLTIGYRVDSVKVMTNVTVSVPNHADYDRWCNYQYQLCVRNKGTAAESLGTWTYLYPQPTRGSANTYAITGADIMALNPTSDTCWALSVRAKCDTTGSGNYCNWTIDAAGSLAVVRNTDEFDLVPWIGDHRQGSPGDTIGWWNSYPLFVRAVHADYGIGIDGIRVDWDADYNLGAVICPRFAGQFAKRHAPSLRTRLG
jgi:hypothetical protein